MAHVRLENLEKHFGEVVAVNSINLTINSGEFVVLLGPSGCGKTTTLRMVAGLEEVTSGRIFINDKDVAHVHARDRNVAMVFQSYALYPHMTVERNLSFALRLRKITPDIIDRRVREVAALLGLEGMLQRKPKSLSGGQQQRVALGRAMVRDPSVFLFDEPLSNLDAKLRAEMRTEIIKLHQRIDATMIYVTHDQIEAMTMADRIVVMHQGQIQQIGIPLEIYDDPNDAFVAGFIGSPAMNIFPGAVKTDEDCIWIEAAFSLRMPKTHPARAVAFARFGIRPECLSIEPDPGDHTVPGRIETVEHLGSETILTVSTGGPELTVKSRRDSRFRHGDRVHVFVDPKNFLVFDNKIGARIRA